MLEKVRKTNLMESLRSEKSLLGAIGSRKTISADVTCKFPGLSPREEFHFSSKFRENRTNGSHGISFEHPDTLTHESRVKMYTDIFQCNSILSHECTQIGVESNTRAKCTKREYSERQ